ncbi:hypothetical protein CCR94_12490 [Rhodoblastus sphagnicola]|uniref:Uncharacterized protein n=1 Tax=Rhodoblastus sphagnicola TaxID=333368 RepID=A0A2S6N778_9HYPH|nr:MotA/TolQ/ExbB proton channel family protein [Rhodoblastus sphagnicola]MBB4197423.1 hypothetical protein [Rhodoblastus sphagnicola]PPQ30468.1 hypothetical protein CCR94_12490 [Rhodoblastus sphagnicola]
MTSSDPYRLTPPTMFLVRMAVFLTLVGFVGFILNKQIKLAFFANPGLNGLIVGVELFGIILSIMQVTRLYREIAWVGGEGARDPILLAPMARILSSRGDAPLTQALLRHVLDSLATRLDESRETSRYLTGLMVFLGLLGTFWGLLETVGSISGVISSLQGGSEMASLFNDLKSGLARPLSGMSLAFTSSLFGLAGSLVLGFLDLQAGQAQNRFFIELEDRLSDEVDTEVYAPVAPGHDSIQHLAAGVQSMVQHMRQEQQLIRDWVEAQAERQELLQSSLDQLFAAQDREPR